MFSSMGWEEREKVTRVSECINISTFMQNVHVKHFQMLFRFFDSFNVRQETEGKVSFSMDFRPQVSIVNESK